MSFVQYKLDKIADQTRGIFNKYFYDPGNGDSSVDALTPGYFSRSRFINDPDWDGSFLECVLSDGVFLLVVTGGTAVIYGYSDKKHFGVYSVATLAVSIDPDNPTYVSSLQIFPSSSFGIDLTDPNNGILQNNTGKTLTMAGNVTFQVNNATGGPANFRLWAETSDDGVNFTAVDGSLRNVPVPNQNNSTQTKAAGIEAWANGQYARFAFYNQTGSNITLQAPTDTVNTNQLISGFSFYHQLSEV